MLENNNYVKNEFKDVTLTQFKSKLW